MAPFAAFEARPSLGLGPRLRLVVSPRCTTADLKLIKHNSTFTFDPADPDPFTGAPKAATLSPCSRLGGLPSTINMFPGFRYRYRANFVVNEDLLQPLIRHARTIICDNDPRLFDYLVQWLAHMVQVPDCKPESAPLLRSVKGAGDGLFFDIIARVLGRVNVAGIQGNKCLKKLWGINTHLAFNMMVVCKDVTYNAAALGGRITDDYMTHEAKHMDAQCVPSYERWVFLSDSAKPPLRLTPADRRFACFAVSAARVGDKDYFAQLTETYKEGSEALEHLYHFLMRVVLVDRRVVLPPMTDLKRELLGLPVE